jgi:hypothetical protein
VRPSRRLISVFGGLLLAAGGIGAVLALGGHATRGRAHHLARVPGPPGVAAAYGYPGQCLSVTILATHPSYARADFNHGRPCGMYGGDTTTLLHRVDGAWHVILDAAAYSCPLTAVPLQVQSALGICLVQVRKIRAAARSRRH